MTLKEAILHGAEMAWRKGWSIPKNMRVILNANRMHLTYEDALRQPHIEPYAPTQEDIVADDWHIAKFVNVPRKEDA